MVDIQFAPAQNRRGKKEERKKKPPDKKIEWPAVLPPYIACFNDTAGFQTGCQTGLKTGLTTGCIV